MQNIESPEKNDFRIWANAYDHWDWSEDGTVIRVTTVIPNPKIDQEKNDSIRGRRLTDSESMDVAFQDPPDISDEEWLVAHVVMTPERVETFKDFFRNK